MARVAVILVVLALLVSLFGTTPALAARGRTPPTKPSNLRVTSLTSYQVGLAWNLSTDNSGTFPYRVVVSDGGTYTVPQTQTTFTLFVGPVGTYAVYVYAPAGHHSPLPVGRFSGWRELDLSGTRVDGLH